MICCKDPVKSSSSEGSTTELENHFSLFIPKIPLNEMAKQGLCLELSYLLAQAGAWQRKSSHSACNMPLLHWYFSDLFSPCSSDSIFFSLDRMARLGNPRKQLLHAMWSFLQTFLTKTSELFLSFGYVGNIQKLKSLNMNVIDISTVWPYCF